MTTRLQNLVYSLPLVIAGLSFSFNTAAQLFPVADISATNWAPEELTPVLEVEDNNFIFSPYGSHASGEVEMSDDIVPGIYNLFTVRVVARKFPEGDAQSSANRGLNINVRINNMLLTVQSITDLTDVFTAYNFVYAGNFTHEDLATLQVLFSTTGRINGQNRRQAQIDQIEVLLPDPAPLPVKLKSFNANRKQARVELNWVTVTEQNNSGFELQRNSGAGGWQVVDFIPSQATDGNSQAELHYYYSDANDARGVTQYRLKQIDIDNHFMYSAIRAVQGMSQSGRTLIIPNPSADGNLNVLFNGAANRNLQLTDMAGRIIRQWNNYAENSLQILSLLPGSYVLRIFDSETNAMQVEKIMVR